jgi:hypothetical protein
VPVTVQWRLTEALAERMVTHLIQVPLFDRSDLFRFEDTDESNSRNRLLIATSQGRLQLPAKVRRESSSDGETHIVVEATRTLVALASGDVELPAPSIVTEEAVRWQRGFMGTREPAQVRRTRTTGSSLKLSVQPLPRSGRPASFSGSVGSGLSLSVNADRSVVQTGEPINLSIEVRGDASLENLSLPALEAMGLDPTRFKLPASASIPGRMSDGAKHFELPVRALADSVTEIPPLELAWFDPQSGDYQRARSEPIALSVRRANRVSATAVVRGDSPDSSAALEQGNPGDTTPPTDAAGAGTSPPTSPTMVASGADLSVQTDVQALLEGHRGTLWTRPAVMLSLYAGGALALAGSMLHARRRRRDPRELSRQRELRALAGALDRADSAAALATTLRRLAPLLGPPQRQQHAQLMAHCDAITFRPGATASSEVDSDLRAQALALITAAQQAGYRGSG